MLPKRAILRHALIREGQPLPDEIESWDWVRHIEAEEEGTGLHIWWFAHPEEDD